MTARRTADTGGPDTGGGADHRAGRGVLLGAAGLHMVTQAALAPFYPQLFREVYGVRELGATGTFLMLCQLAAVIALPLWGRATRHVPLPRLVTAGQGAAVVLAASLALAPSYAVFTALSVALVAAKAVVLLAYPALARNHPRGLLPGVVQYVAVLHGAAVAATLLGTVVVSVPEPRLALPLLAVAETVLLAGCVALLRRPGRDSTGDDAGDSIGDNADAPVGKPVGKPATVPDVPATGAPRRARLLRLAAFVLVNAVAVHSVRPYFTEYAERGGAATGIAALLFLLPHLAVLTVLPAAGVLHRRLGAWLLPLAFALAAAGLVWQAAETAPVPLSAARLLFGAGLGLSHVALDRRVLAATGPGPAYSVIAAAQTCGLLLAPMLATATVTASLNGPLYAGALLLAALALLAPLSAEPPRIRPDAPSRGGPRPADFTVAADR